MTSGRVARWGPIAVYVAMVITFLRGQYSRVGFPLDDAWIHRVYSRSFALGRGFEYNPGQQEAGSTSPAWAIVTAPAHWLEWLGTDVMVFAVKLLGILLGALCVFLVGSIAYRLTRSEPIAGLAAAMFALDPRLAFSALSGMETLLLVAVLLGACTALMHSRHLLFLFLLGIAPVVRPEAVIMLPLAALGIGRAFAEENGGARRALALVLPVLPSGVWAIFCLLATGSPLPNTYHVKATAVTFSINLLAVGWQGLTHQAALSGLALLSGMTAFLFLSLRTQAVRARGGLLASMIMICFPLLYVTAVVASRHFYVGGYYWTRWVDPASLLLVAASTIALAALAVTAWRDLRRANDHARSRYSWTRRAFGAVAVLLVLGSVPTFSLSFEDSRFHLEADSRAIDIMNVRMGEWIRDNTPEDTVLGVNDAGAIRYFGERFTIDLLGLNNSHIARGEVTIEQALEVCDSLAVFPAWFHPSDFYRFEPSFQTELPLAEYTVAVDPAQTRMVAYRRLDAQ